VIGKYLHRVETAVATTSDNYIEVEEEKEVEDIEDYEINDGSLKPPPLPSSSNNNKNENDIKKSNVNFKIVKSTKEKEPVVATGWQAVMAEMQRKKEAMFGGGGLKKVEINNNENNKNKDTNLNKKKKKKKKGEFKDVMDELAYKLAKLRGEIAESEDDDDDDDNNVGGSIKSNNSKAPPSQPQTPISKVDSKITKVTSSKNNDNDNSSKKLKSESKEIILDKDSLTQTKLPSKSNMMDLLSDNSQKKMNTTNGTEKEKSSKSEDEKVDIATKDGKSQDKSNEEVIPKAKKASSEVAALFAKRTNAPEVKSEDKSSEEMIPKAKKASSEVAALFAKRTNVPEVKSEDKSNEEVIPKAKKASSDVAALFAKRANNDSKTEAPPTSVEPVSSKSSTNQSLTLVSQQPLASSITSNNSCEKSNNNKIVPAPPPLPTTWPPKPYTVVEPINTNQNIKKNVSLIGVKLIDLKIQPKMKKIMVKVKKLAPPTVLQSFIDEIKELPSGYYMPAPVVGMVQPKHIVISGSKTTNEQCESMNLVFNNRYNNNNSRDNNDNDLNSSFNSLNRSNYHYLMMSRKTLRTSITDHYDNNNNNDVTNDEQIEIDKILKNKLTISDLPIPANYNYEINRLQKANELRKSVLIEKKKLALRNYLDNDDSINDNNEDHTTKNDIAKKLEVTKPIAPKSYYDKINQNKMHSYHHHIEKSHEDKLPIYHRYEDSISKGSSPYSSLLQADLHPQDIHFISTLRSSTPSSSSNSSSKLNFSSSQSTSLSSPCYDDKHKNNNHSKSTHKQTALSTASPHQTSASNQSKNDDNTYQTSGSKYFSYYRPQTEIKSFTFETDKILSRRNIDKELKLKKQQEEEKKIKNKKQQQKLKMKQKAIENAQDIGVYKSPLTRYHYHQKILNKYNNNVEIIGNVNLQHEIKLAYHAYSKQHLLNTHENDTLYSTKDDRLQAIKNIQHIEYMKDMNMILDLQKEFNDYDINNDNSYATNNTHSYNGINSSKKYIHT